MQKDIIRSCDGGSSELRWWAAGSSEQPVFLVLPAMGVRADYYAPLARALHEGGFGVALAELRGHGSSSLRASRSCDFGYRELVEIDFEAYVAAARDRFPGAPIIPVGHSLGGQLACLHSATHPEAFAGIVLITACSLYYRSWGISRGLGFLFFGQASRWLAVAFGHYPGHRLGFAGREAMTLMRDWAHQGRTGCYEVSGSEHDYETLLAEVKLPILAVSFSDDLFFCPPRAVDHLLAKMGAARSEHLRIAPHEAGAEAIGHFSWVRQPHVVVPRIHEWLERQLEVGG